MALLNPMKILSGVYKTLLLETPQLPPESGGIIGGQEGIITQACFDRGSNPLNMPSVYVPNINFLNQIIKRWAKEDITFCGIFHSHFSRDRELSLGDKEYIAKIMYAMPPHIGFLYFPIVLPRDTVIGYQANRYGSDVHIVCDKIEILQTGG